MVDNTLPICIRFVRRGGPTVQIPFEAYWDTNGFVLRDGEGDEHHFGFREVEARTAIYTHVASYRADGRDASWPGGVYDELVEWGFELADPTRGPKLSPLVAVALDELAEEATHKGFAFDYERELAVRYLAALVGAGETLDPDEIFVHAALSGYGLKDAERLREYARRALSGGGTRTVAGRSIRLEPAMGERMTAHWRKKLEQPEDGEGA